MRAYPALNMRKSLLLLLPAGALLAIALGWSNAQTDPARQAQPLQHEVRVINIEVPVRVFKGDEFVGALTMSDFEVLEDDVPQDIEAVYLINKAEIERREEIRPFAPETSRSFYLFFVLYEYDARIREAVSYFINRVMRPEDRLFVVTAKATYRMKTDRFAEVPKQTIVDQLTGLIRKDILIGELAYRNVLSRLKQMSGSKVKSIENQMVDTTDLGEMGFASEEEFMMQLRADLAQLEDLRRIDESKLFNFADFLKDVKGQKHVFLFYQREFTPTLDKNKQISLQNNPVLGPMAAEISDLYKRMTTIAVDRLKKACADSSVTVNFLYLTTIPTDIDRDQMEERSWDIYESFSAMAQATGGVVSSSSNTAALMEKAATSSENYYLLYYSPRNKTADGKFRRIEVKTKPGPYRVEHLAGYLAK